MSEYHKKVWGSEEWIVNREYCGKVLRVDRGASCSMHLHKIKHETFYCMDGMVELTTWPDFDAATGKHQVKIRTMGLGDTAEIPPGLPHSFKGVLESVIIEFSTYHEDSDSYRFTPSSKGA